MRPSQAPLPRPLTPRLQSSAARLLASGDDAPPAVACDAFVARCLRRLLADDRRSAGWLSAVAPPAPPVATLRATQRAARVPARRPARAVSPVLGDEVQRVLNGELDAGLLRRRYPWIVALLRELAEL